MPGCRPTDIQQMEAPASNRRIGERMTTPTLSITWRVPRKTRFRTKVVDEPVQVANASATGAALVAPTVEGLVLRSLVELNVGGRAVTAKIVRDEPTPIVGMTCYGVQFTDPDPSIIEFLLAQGGSADDRDELERLWRRAN